MQSAPIDLNRVRQLFSQPAALQAADFINREIAARMLERLQLVRLDPAQVVDAGCGRGAEVGVLQNNYPNAQIIGIDASQELLQLALQEPKATALSMQGLLSKWLFSGKKNSNLINGDFCRTSLADQATDLVWSNLALHWHPEPDQVFKEWRRILRVNGLLMFSCFGPDSLKEIRHAFNDIDQTPHTLPFVDMHDFGDMLVGAGFATPVMDMEVITLTYSTAAQLLAEVRSMGGNPLQTRGKGLIGKMAWQHMCNKLEQLRNEDGLIPLTLEIIYGHAFKPAPKRGNPGESIIKFEHLKK
ncbi:methyltransferase domain-containing protein [Solimicrobium silvestre]|uniref:Malonyl-[acyl-carrier protein] O-methyltransferase n=1 Tax=Solimicrobium silvestre TaxID=2099400 RepID=A0A2S9H181_9BURK|nr:methyltransferase domain-containing protein [Solimicrobium silvestre]PRC93703.1 Methyltransferase domain [Solimicrobium silvestre]